MKLKKVKYRQELEEQDAATNIRSRDIRRRISLDLMIVKNLCLNKKLWVYNK